MIQITIYIYTHTYKLQEVHTPIRKTLQHQLQLLHHQETPRCPDSERPCRTLGGFARQFPSFAMEIRWFLSTGWWFQTLWNMWVRKKLGRLVHSQLNGNKSIMFQSPPTSGWFWGWLVNFYPWMVDVGICHVEDHRIDCFWMVDVGFLFGWYCDQYGWYARLLLVIFV